MAKYVAWRLIQAIGVVLGVTLAVALAIRASGDPAVAMFQGTAGPTPEELERIRHALGIDRPFIIQYVEFLKGLLTGDLGTSFRTGQPVSRMLGERMLPTLILAVSSSVVALILSVPLGMGSAVRRGRGYDRFVRLFSLLGLSFPNFWLALMLIMIFGVRLRWLPPSGYSGWSSLILPAMTLGLILTASTVRVMRAALLEILTSQFVLVARAKGLPERSVLYKHAGRNAAIPVVTFTGLQVGALLGGVVIIEQVFAWPGLGSLALNAIGYRDYPVLQGAVAVLSILVVAANLLVDLSYAWLDPRIRVN